MIRTLLFSPLSGLDPASGDTAYTAALTSAPPEGVSYTTYAAAIESGEVRIRGRRSPRQWSDWRDPLLAIGRGAELGTRRLGATFREPNWFVSIEPGAFDLVHQHLFQVRQVGPQLPVVTSAGYPLSVLYGNREGWSERRLRVATALEHLGARLMRVNNPWVAVDRRSISIFYSERFRDYAVARGFERERTRVLSTVLAELEYGERRPHPFTVGFVGRDFDLKGGEVAIEAFRLIKERLPDARALVLTTTIPEDIANRLPAGVEVVLGPSREEVLRTHLPRIDVLLLPTRSDCGAPYALLEALQCGIPTVVSDCEWLDERLVAPAVRRAANDPSIIAGHVIDLVESDKLDTAGAAAHELWRSEFSPAAFNAGLLEAYQAALALPR